MERNEDAHNLDEPKVNYRGVKAMPFVVGKKIKVNKGKQYNTIQIK